MERNLLHRFVLALGALLNVGEAPKPADCIFVFAGRPERKKYGLELYRQGYSSRIVFSVARFEWRRFCQLGLDDDGGLVPLVQRTPPEKRHFFVMLDQERATAFPIPKGRLGTWSEAAALARFVNEKGIKSILVVSSAYHLRRASAALDRQSFEPGQHVTPVAVPEPDRGLFEALLYIGEEYLKCFLYWLAPIRHSR